MCVVSDLSVGGGGHAVESGLGGDPEHAADGIAVAGPERGQLDGRGAAPGVKERQLSVLHPGTQHRLVLPVEIDRRQVVRRLQHQLRTHRVHCKHTHTHAHVGTRNDDPCMYINCITG